MTLKPRLTQSLKRGGRLLSDPYRRHRYLIEMANETDEQRAKRLEKSRNRMRAHRARIYATETEEEREARLEEERARRRAYRAHIYATETDEEREARRAAQRAAYHRRAKRKRAMKDI